MYYRGMRLGAKPLGRGFPGAPTRYTSRPRRFASFPSCTCLRRTGGLKRRWVSLVSDSRWQSGPAFAHAVK